MRLWHYSLIPYLPDSQLKGQWRECSLISVSLKKNNTPNHILVNRITDYGIDDYYTYCYFVEVEMNMRKFNITYKSKEKVYNSLFAFKRSDEPFELRVGVNGPIFSGWHNKEYLRVCMANLYENTSKKSLSSQKVNLKSLKLNGKDYWKDTKQLRMRNM